MDDLRCAKCLEGWRTLLEERDRRYDDRFEAQKTAMEMGFRAQRELNNAVAEASNRAINKSEDAQREYNQRSNEFRGALDDQAKQISYDEKFENQRREISILREAKSVTEGRGAVMGEQKSQSNWSTGILVAILLSVGSMLLTLLRDVIR